MAQHSRTTSVPPVERPDANDMDKPLPDANDPGDAHRKGYAPEPGPAKPAPAAGPVPVASTEEVEDHARKPDQAGATGRSGPHDDTPNDRPRGSDR